MEAFEEPELAGVDTEGVGGEEIEFDSEGSWRGGVDRPRPREALLSLETALVGVPAIAAAAALLRWLDVNMKREVATAIEGRKPNGKWAKEPTYACSESTKNSKSCSQQA
jgi:hypothetical protein